MGDHRLHRLALGKRRSGLFQSCRRQARADSDRHCQRRGELRLRSRGPLSDRRADHGAGTLVPSAGDERHRPGDLRCGLRRAPRAMARHERAESRERRTVASRAPGGRRGTGGRPGIRRAAQALDPRGASLATKSRRPAAPAAQRARTPCRARRQPAAIRIRRRRCDSDPLADTASARKPYFIFGDARIRWISGSSIWPTRLRFSSPARKRGYRPQGPEDLTGAASYDQGEWSVIFKRPLHTASGAPFAPGEFMPVAFSVWDGFSRERGNRRGLTLCTPSMSSRRSSPRRSADVENGAVHSRDRIGGDRLGAAAGPLRERGKLGGEPTQPATTTA